jgi:predicted alpha/beta superfamily hydrolase
MSDRPWAAYEPSPDPTVVGDVRVTRDAGGDHVPARRVMAALPPDYGAHDRPHPVLYCHDGGNLFDEGDSYGGVEWQVDETLYELDHAGPGPVVVGVPNAGDDRVHEYTMYDHPEHGPGRADDYLAFLVETVRPLVEEAFAVRTDRAGVGTLGSSLGGLVSAYALFEHPGVFGFAGALSPAFWWADFAVFDHLADAPAPGGRVYLDVGTEESDDPEHNARYLDGTERMADVLAGRVDAVTCRVVEGDGHGEAAWARRFPDALAWFLEGA